MGPTFDPGALTRTSGSGEQARGQSIAVASLSRELTYRLASQVCSRRTATDGNNDQALHDY